MDGGKGASAKGENESQPPVVTKGVARPDSGEPSDQCRSSITSPEASPPDGCLPRPYSLGNPILPCNKFAVARTGTAVAQSRQLSPAVLKIPRPEYPSSPRTGRESLKHRAILEHVDRRARR